ncbi:type II secretion system F family protein [Novosphingobium sp. PhB55]|jgi:tight adherence protein B|uniref:type II secretion system F family protein n=1 Tax=unclassified Novosphingobium TaxID=2644732 RepID=UPI001066EE5A|nr:type II secretion system F family protein [Novosphingobium sp. PhB55]TDW67132.1 tight adherence protein B [Novosphingobium sp. PhB55]
MVKGAAYLILALLILGGVLFALLGERARSLAAIDRRLAGLTTPGSAPVRSSVAISVPERIAPLLAQAQLEITVQTVRLLALVGLGLVFLVLVLAGPAFALGVLLGLPMAALSWLRGRARKRVDALTEALPLYLDGVRQLQAVGNSLSQALARALADASPVVRSFFDTAARRLEMGAPVAETMQQLADRIQVPEVSMIAAAIRTNLRYGGSIGAVFTNLAHILRERLRIRRELVAATSEAKVSSRVLIAMPLLAMIGLVLMNPAYLDFFISDSRGRSLSFLAIGLEVAGILIIRRMLRLEF